MFSAKEIHNDLQLVCNSTENVNDLIAQFYLRVRLASADNTESNEIDSRTVRYLPPFVHGAAYISYSLLNRASLEGRSPRRLHELRQNNVSVFVVSANAEICYQQPTCIHGFPFGAMKFANFPSPSLFPAVDTWLSWCLPSNLRDFLSMCMFLRVRVVAGGLGQRKDST